MSLHWARQSICRLDNLRERGVSSLEAAVLVPLVFLLALVGVDFARWGLQYATLQYAAFQAVEQLSRKDMAVVTSVSGCLQHPQDCQRFRAELVAAEATAVRIAEMLISPDRLHPFNHFETGSYAGPSWATVDPSMRDTSLRIGIQRPGERVEAYDHPTRHHGIGEGQGWPNGGLTWPDLLYGKTNVTGPHPLVVRIEATFEPFTPLLPELKLRAVQMAYAQQVAINSSAQTPPFCGDLICDPSSENCGNCATDCGPCTGPCGNGVCDSTLGETCASCAPDCGGCPVCGNGLCESGETLATCCADCALPGDGICSACAQETCVSEPACGPCAAPTATIVPPPVCGNGVFELFEECEPPAKPCPAFAGYIETCTDCKCNYAEIPPPTPTVPFEPTPSLPRNSTPPVLQHGGL